MVDKISESSQTSSSILMNEIERYRKRGLNNIIGVVLSLFYVGILPKMIQPLYSSLPTHNPYFVFSLGFPLVCISAVLFLIYCFDQIYFSNSEFFKKFKILAEPWPWESSPLTYNQEYTSIILNTLFGFLVIVPIANMFLVYFGIISLTTSPDLFPSTFEIATNLLLMIIVDDTLFYWSHRLLHLPMFFEKFHKQHHTYKVTVAIVAMHAHPIEYLITGVLPTYAVPMLLRVNSHVITLYLFGIFQMMHQLEAHSGFEFPWSPFGVLPFSQNISVHDFHHSHYIGNFGKYFTLWDSVCGTNKIYLKFLAKKKL